MGNFWVVPLWHSVNDIYITFCCNMFRPAHTDMTTLGRPSDVAAIYSMQCCNLDRINDIDQPQREDDGAWISVEHFIKKCRRHSDLCNGSAETTLRTRLSPALPSPTVGGVCIPGDECRLTVFEQNKGYNTCREWSSELPYCQHSYLTSYVKFHSTTRLFK
jgi:hypothetical protein